MNNKSVYKLFVNVAIVSMALVTSNVYSSTIFITGGSINGTSLSSTQWDINASQGEVLSGTISITVTREASGPGVVLPLGYTWTWGARETSISSIATESGPGTQSYNVPINLNAPASDGVYYILFGTRGEFNLSQVFSATNWTASNSGVWHDGNDYYDMSDSDLLFAHENGYVANWPLLTSGGYIIDERGNGVAPIRINVGAVPVPPAVWLFGSGLIGLIGIARRKKS